MANVNINEPVSANIKSDSKVTLGGHGGLVGHIMYLVRQNRMVRDRLYKRKWDQYERTFRGLYSGMDRTRDGERSKLVAPALAAAIESTAATMEDAIFSRERWFDVSDNIGDDQPDDVKQAHNHLEEDFNLAGVPEQIAKVVLNGCLYGTGIGKINITRREVRKVVNGEVVKDYRPLVTLEAIPPWEFVIDSQARDIESALFVAHETHVPRNVIWTKQKKNITAKSTYRVTRRRIQHALLASRLPTARASPTPLMARSSLQSTTGWSRQACSKVLSTSRRKTYRVMAM